MFNRENTRSIPKPSVSSPMWDDGTVDFSREAVLKKLMKLAMDNHLDLIESTLCS